MTKTIMLNESAVREYLRSLGRKGGSSRSAKKQAASRVNGRKNVNKKNNERKMKTEKLKEMGMNDHANQWLRRHQCPYDYSPLGQHMTKAGIVETCGYCGAEFSQEVIRLAVEAVR